ncbi:hypothetical protein Cgig2_004965 [Carnegiea gigantea]|uniref:NAD(P)-binding domain-containing protein n=1 Tax=Carnegiea gigantea TaxID=171969 RepID=A0A9Q1KZP7_9CARY|nr:hypothetical protein Cgig2_004965 [Carnegiea gigantea]
MAATSNSFLITTTPHSRLALKTPRQVTVFAKNGSPFPSFRPRKPALDEESDEGGSANTNRNPFQFKWGKISYVKSLIPVVSSPPAFAGPARRKDTGTVFVAGATVFSFFVMNNWQIISREESKRLNAVESVFEDAESIAKAIGNASKVVVTIGPTENGPADKVTTSDALQVVEAAQLAGVGHVAVIYDEAASTASPTSVLNGISTFFNNLFSRSQPLTIAEFLEKVIQTDVKYTFIRSTLTDDFSPESDYNVVVAAEGSASKTDYKVSRLQMAALVANLFSNTGIAEDKVVEVYTDPSAPMKPLDELFSVIPEDGRRKAYEEALAKAKAEEEARKAEVQALEAEEAKRRLKEEMKRVSEQEARAPSPAEEAKQKAKEGGTSVNGFVNKAKDLATGFSWENFGSQLASMVKTLDLPTIEVEIATVQGKAQNLSAQKAVIKPTQQGKPKSKPKPEPEIEERGEEVKVEVKSFFGGLVKQETYYIDDD